MRNEEFKANGLTVEEKHVLELNHRDHIITNDEELIEFARKASHDWYDSGWHKTFTTFYLSDYALSEPRRSLTKGEFNRLVELQKKAQKVIEDAEKERGWKLLRTECFADNSKEEVYQDKDGNIKRVMTVFPNGD